MHRESLASDWRNGGSAGPPEWDLAWRILTPPVRSALPFFPFFGEVGHLSCPITETGSLLLTGSGTRLFAWAKRIGRHRGSFPGMEAGIRNRDKAAVCGKASWGSCARDGARSNSGWHSS